MTKGLMIWIKGLDRLLYVLAVLRIRMRLIDFIHIFQAINLPHMLSHGIKGVYCVIIVILIYLVLMCILCQSLMDSCCINPMMLIIVIAVPLNLRSVMDSLNCMTRAHLGKVKMVPAYNLLVHSSLIRSIEGSQLNSLIVGTAILFSIFLLTVAQSLSWPSASLVHKQNIVFIGLGLRLLNLLKMPLQVVLVIKVVVVNLYQRVFLFVQRCAFR